MPRSRAEDLIAEFDLLGRVRGFGEGVETSFGRLEGIAGQPIAVSAGWLFTSQHRGLSLKEMDIFRSHVSAAEGVDEDFFDNFS